MTNNEKFNRMINSCSDPRRMLDTLRALAPLLRDRNEQRRMQDAAAHLEEEEDAAVC